MGLPLNRWFIMENANLKWMRTGGSPISGNLHSGNLHALPKLRHEVLLRTWKKSTPIQLSTAPFGVPHSVWRILNIANTDGGEIVYDNFIDWAFNSAKVPHCAAVEQLMWLGGV